MLDRVGWALPEDYLTSGGGLLTPTSLLPVSFSPSPWYELFSALIISSYPQLSAGKVIIFSLKVCQISNREVRGGEVLGPMWRAFKGWRDWVGGVGGWW